MCRRICEKGSRSRCESQLNHGGTEDRRRRNVLRADLAGRSQKRAGACPPSSWREEVILDRFEERGVLDGDVDIVAARLLEVVALAEHAVEFVDEQGDGLVALVGLDDGVHVRPVDFDVALGLEPMRDGFVAVALQLHANPHDAVLVTKQSLGFLSNERLKGGCEFEMNARDDEFVVVLSVHDTPFVLVSENQSEGSG